MGGIKSNQPYGFVTLREFVESHSKPKQSVVSLIGKIREASAAGDTDRKTQLKEQLPFVTPSIIVDEYRRYANIRRFTGLAQLDFDKIDNAIELRDHIFNEYKSIVCAYVSPSQTGLKALIRIPIVKTVHEFQEYYLALEEEFGAFDGFDSAPKNAVLPLFYSYDYFLSSRETEEIWTDRIEKTVEEHRARPVPPTPYRHNSNAKDRTIRIFENKIREINSGTGGHPNVRAAALVLGTRVGAGYITYFDAVSLAEREINLNSYLSKGTVGYIKTAIWGIETGMKTPKNY